MMPSVNETATSVVNNIMPTTQQSDHVVDMINQVITNNTHLTPSISSGVAVATAVCMIGYTDPATVSVITSIAYSNLHPVTILPTEAIASIASYLSFKDSNVVSADAMNFLNAATHLYGL